MASLFLEGVARDRWYAGLRDSRYLAEDRAHLEAMWERFEPYADRNFRRAIQDNFVSRYWEMFIGCSLLDAGFKPENDGSGPDFTAAWNGTPMAYVECVAPGGGTGEDSVPPETTWVPQDDIVIRYHSAIRDKELRYADWLREDKIDEDIPFIVALNPRRMTMALAPARPPRIVQALYAGAKYLNLNPDGDWIEAYEPRPTRRKRSGAKVRTDVFLDETYASISAVVYACLPQEGIRCHSGRDLLLAHNAGARRPVPRGWLGCGEEVWVEGDKLIHRRR